MEAEATPCRSTPYMVFTTGICDMITLSVFASGEAPPWMEIILSGLGAAEIVPVLELPAAESPLGLAEIVPVLELPAAESPLGRAEIAPVLVLPAVVSAPAAGFDWK